MVSIVESRAVHRLVPTRRAAILVVHALFSGAIKRIGSLYRSIAGHCVTYTAVGAIAIHVHLCV